VTVSHLLRCSLFSVRRWALDVQSNS